jgi:hypothetical protein
VEFYGNWKNFKPYWNQVSEGVPARTEPVFWENIQELIRRLDWYRTAENLMEKDPLKACDDMRECERKLRYPGKWMNDWMQYQIENQEYWTVEAWLPSNGKMVKYYQSLEPRATKEEFYRQIHRLAQACG